MPIFCFIPPLNLTVELIVIHFQLGGFGGGREANLNSRWRDLDFGFGEMVIPQEGPGGPSHHNGGTRPGGDGEANLNSRRRDLDFGFGEKC